MSRLIDANEYKARIDRYPPSIRDIAKKELGYCKTVDASPVKHGHWIWSDDLCEYCCSRCGHTDDYGIHPDIEYCPYCGAKMDEVTGFGM